MVMNPVGAYILTHIFPRHIMNQAIIIRIMTSVDEIIYKVENHYQFKVD